MIQGLKPRESDYKETKLPAAAAVVAAAGVPTDDCSLCTENSKHLHNQQEQTVG